MLFDACVLFPQTVRDVLMQLAVAGLCRGRWTDRIHDEWIDAVLRARPGLAERLARTRRKMDEAVPDALITGYEHLIPTLSLPDADDRHVLAAAIHAEAPAIITFNLKDFPAERLAPYGIEAIHPDAFVASILGGDPPRVCRAFREIRSRLRSPPYTAEEYIAELRAQGLTTVAGMLERHTKDI